MTADGLALKVSLALPVPLRVCIFDPDDHSGFLLADQLVGLPARVDVVTAATGMAAIAAACDVMVSVAATSTSGLSRVIEGFRALAGTCAPVVVLTQMAADVVRISALSAGADYALTLPVSAAELHAIVRCLVRRSSAGAAGATAGAADATASARPEDGATAAPAASEQ